MNISGYEKITSNNITANSKVGIGTTTPVTSLSTTENITMYPNTYLGINGYFGSSAWHAWQTGYVTVMKHDNSNGQLNVQQSKDSETAGNIPTFTSGFFKDGTYNNPSDDRLKDQETLISDATTTLMKLRPEKYRRLYITYDENGDEVPTNTGMKDAGLVAQEVYYQAPELRHIVTVPVGANPTPGVIIPDDPTVDLDYEALGWTKKFAGLNYTGFIPYLIKMNQEQQLIIEAQNSIISSLQTTVQNLTTRIEALENP